MPDEQPGKQRWREVPPLSDDERWVLDNPPPLPPPLPQRSPRRPPGDPPPLELEDYGPQEPRHASNGARPRDTFRPPDQMLTEALRRQRAAAQPKPVGANTKLAAVLAIVAIALIVLLTMFLAKQS